MIFLRNLVVITFIFISASYATEDDYYDDDYLIEEFLKTTESSTSPAPLEGLSQVQPSKEATVIDLVKPVSPTAFSNESGSHSNCQCVKYFLCDVENGETLPSGDVAGLFDIRNGGIKKSECTHYFDICCKKLKKEVPPPSKSVFLHSTCGKRNTGGVGFRITGALDGEAQFGEFPWMVAIIQPERRRADKPPVNFFVCGGSLIHPKVVMTAAHCVFGNTGEGLKARLGEWDTQTPDELYPHVDRQVEKVIIKEDYYPGGLHNDIALLILEDEVPLAPNVDTVCLPSQQIDYSGQNCFASGWGKDVFGKEGKYQVILKKVEVPIVSRTICETSLRTTRLGPYFELHDSFVCAGGKKDQDTCRGDGGSPLVCQVPGKSYYVQYGIVAWGIGCGEEGIPGVYVNVGMFTPWIYQQLEKLSLDTKYFEEPN